LRLKKRRPKLKGHELLFVVSVKSFGKAFRFLKKNGTILGRLGSVLLAVDILENSGLVARRLFVHITILLDL
jgi:hypothetical protein